ncbi:MAG: zinc-ribbon domain-containing protein [Desulfobacula sp.]|nr:zinc-ribbon domain-containing protein [Desulfobacula sp.]
MNVICRHCNTKLVIPDHKVPDHKDATLKCPRCKGSILIHPEKMPEAPYERVAQEKKEQQKRSSLSFEDRQRALICIDSDELTKKAQPLLRQMGFNIEIVKDIRTALEKMEYHIYNLVLIDDGFDQQKGLAGIIGRMNTMDMSLRRRICLVLISQKFKTNDNMAALHTSVNSIIRGEDIVHLDAFLLRVLAEHKQFYTVYNESLKQAGKA